MALPVLAATLTTAIVFFPVTFLYGVSQFLFTALALSVVIALFASYIVAMTVVPLFCANLLKPHAPHHEDVSKDGLDHEVGDDEMERARNGSPEPVKARAAKTKRLGWGARFNRSVQRRVHQVPRSIRASSGSDACIRPLLTVIVILAVFGLSFLLSPLDRARLLPADRPGPVRDEPQGGDRHARHRYRGAGREGRGHDPQGSGAGRSQDHRVEHRHQSGYLRDL